MSKDTIQLDFKTEQQLYQSYMPFLKGGGLFVATTKAFTLGQELLLDVLLLDEPKRLQVKGVVAWLTPDGAQGGKPQGVGVAFSAEDETNIRSIIETKLAGMLDSAVSTDTM